MFALCSKRDSTSQRAIDAFLKLLTFGGNRSYLTAVVTTLGDKVYIPDGWALDSAGQASHPSS